MDGLRLGDVARPLTPVTPEDTLARAAELLRSAPFDMLPVVAGGSLLGVITERTLAEAAQAVFAGAAGVEQVRLAPLTGDLVTLVPALPAGATLEDAARAFERGPGSLPVVDQDGGYVGMVRRADLLSAVCQARRPPSIGGMATPLGVYLTTGTTSAGGRGSLGLMLTGAAMSLGFILASILLSLLVDGLQHVTGIPILAAMASTPMDWLHLNRYDIWRHLVPLLRLLFFGALLRFSPLAGFHAAEHQVVHAVEKQRPLTPESVAKMPRPHPRCGTRLFAVLVLWELFTEVLPVGDPRLQYVGAAIAILLWWRRLGHHLQQWVTTRPASRKQLQSAIRAAEELLARFEQAPPKRLTLARRLWFMGLPQVVAGGTAAMWIWLVVAQHWPWMARYDVLFR